MLYVIGREYNSKDTGLYRNDGLAVFKNLSSPNSGKKTIAIFVEARKLANNYRV